MIRFKDFIAESDDDTPTDEYVKGSGTGHAFKLNHALRNGHDLDKHQEAVKKHLDKRISSAKPSSKSEVVYRAAPHGTYEKGNYGTAGAHKDHGFVSTSHSYHHVASYAEDDDTIYKIHLPKGSQYHSTAHEDDGYHEKILPRKSVFTVHGKPEERDGKKIVTLKHHGVRD